MTLSGVLFILVGIACALRLGTQKNSRTNLLPLGLFFYHLAFSCFYHWYTFISGSDATGYYLTESPELGLGTHFVAWLTANARDLFFASYLDLFLLFHIAGFIGIWLIHQVVHQASLVPLNKKARQLLLLFLFFPGLHFWTGAIGKDSLTFLGITLFIWAMLKPRNRLLALSAATVFIFVIRPHIAGLLVISTGLAVLMSKNIPMRWRILGFAVIGAMCGIGLPYVIEYIGLEFANPTGFADYISQRQGYNQGGGGGVDISNYPFVFQFLTYLYRPLFLDAPGILGLIVSVENLIFLCLSMLLLTRGFRRILKNHPNALFIRFNLVYWILATSVLASTTANLGIAVRQKTMVTPSLIVLLIIAYALLQYTKATRTYSDGQRVDGG